MYFCCSFLVTYSFIKYNKQINWNVIFNNCNIAARSSFLCPMFNVSIYNVHIPIICCMLYGVWCAWMISKIDKHNWKTLYYFIIIRSCTRTNSYLIWQWRFLSLHDHVPCDNHTKYGNGTNTNHIWFIIFIRFRKKRKHETQNAIPIICRDGCLMFIELDFVCARYLRHPWIAFT